MRPTNASATVVKKVHAAIEHLVHLDSQTCPIAVEFDGGRLLLRGEVPSIRDKKLVRKAASAVEGVTAIADQVLVHTESPPGDGAIRDAICRWLMRDRDFQNCALHACVKDQRETLREAGRYPSGSIEITVADGVVTLAGEVISLSHKRLAGVMAWWARGCRDVINALQVVPPEEDTDDEIIDAVRLVLEADPYVHAEQIAIGSREHEVTLGGIVSSDDERRRAEQDAWSVCGVENVINQIEVG